MPSFNTTITIDGKTYATEVHGYYQKPESATSDSPPVYASFEVEHIYIVPNDKIGLIDLMEDSYNWLVTAELLKELEEEFLAGISEGEYEVDDFYYEDFV